VTPAARRLAPYFALCFLAQIWPLAAVANRIEPRLLGLPFLFFWYVLWVLLIFVGVLLLYLLREPDRGDPEAPPGPGEPGASEVGASG